MLEITFAPPEPNAKKTRHGLQKAVSKNGKAADGEWTKERLLLQFRTMGAFALRDKHRKIELEMKGIEWRHAEKYESARQESLEAYLPSCDKCGEVLVCKTCTRFECDDCGYILQCLRCIRRRDQVSELQNAGAGSRRPKLPINQGVQYSVLDLKRATGDVLYNDPITQLQYEHLEEKQRLEKEITRLSDQLSDLLGKSDTYFDKFHAARADWKVEQQSRVQLELQLANAKAEIRNLSDALTQAKVDAIRLRDICLDTADETQGKVEKVIDRWELQESRSLLAFMFRAWRIGGNEIRVERKVEDLSKQLKTTTSALEEAKALILRMHETIDNQDSKLADQRAKLIAAAKEKISRVLGAWRPHARALKAWGAAALVMKAERQKDIAVTAAGEAFQLLDTNEKQKREISKLSRDLQTSEAEAAKGRLYLEELGRTNRLVKRLKEQITYLEEQRKQDQIRFEEEQNRLKMEIQKIHHSILTDTHASVLHEAIEKLKAELEYERSHHTRKINSFMSTASSSMCGSCGRATLYRSFVEQSSTHERSRDTVTSSSFLPRLQSKNLRDTM